MSTNKPWTRQKLTQMLYHALIGSLTDNAIEIGWVLNMNITQSNEPISIKFMK